MVRNPQVLTQKDYLKAKGLSSPISDTMNDKIHALDNRFTSRSISRLATKNKESINAYHAKRKSAIREFERLKKSGAVREPTEAEMNIRKLKEIKYKALHGDQRSTAVRAAKRLYIKWKAQGRYKKAGLGSKGG